jgi:fatty acid desaturase
MLRHRADWRCVLWVAKYFCLTALAWQHHAMLRLSPARQLAAVAVLCYYSFAGATIVHNTMHARCFRSRSLERLWHHVLSLTYGHPVSTFVPGHNLSHHRHTQTRKDPMRTCKLRFRWNLLNALLFQPTVAWDVLRMDLRYLALKRMQGDAFFARACREWLVLAVAQAALLAHDWRRFALYVWLPHAFAQWAIVSMNMLQHDGCDAECETPGTWNGARNFVGPVLNYLTFNNGFHTIHHLHPTMHWSRLPLEHAKQVRPHIHPALEQRCMARYICAAFVYPGVRVDYRGKAVVLAEANCAGDEDWTLEHAGAGTTLEDYDVDVSLRALCRLVCVLPLKLACPMYSPVHKL